MKLSNSTLQFFYSFAKVGFTLSVLTHGATLLGRNPRQNFPNIWVLHVGIFVAFIPALMAGNDLVGKKLRHQYWKLVMSCVSPGVRYASYGLLIYAIGNFFLCLALLGFSWAGQYHGQPALLDHGHFVRFLSAAEFQRTQSLELRLFSGHWMAFYFAALAMLRAALNSTDARSSVAALNSARSLT